MADEFSRARAKPLYRLADGTIVPSVTTVISAVLGFNKEALIAWANRMGLRGIDTSRYRDEAADAGTCAHEIIRCYFRNVEPDLRAYSQEQIAAAQAAVGAFKEWVRGRRVKLILSEQSLVSEAYRYGGTIDWYDMIDGALTLCDFKTSAMVRFEHKLQLAAYRQLLVENGYQVESIRLLKIGRQHGDFEEHIIRRVDEYWEIFRHALAIYWLKLQVDGRL